jgi:uncharacterized protein (DUF924 family)
MMAGKSFSFRNTLPALIINQLKSSVYLLLLLLSMRVSCGSCFRSFGCDQLSRAVSRSAIDCGLDAQLKPFERLFLYLPFHNSEDAADQQQWLDLLKKLIGLTADHETKAHLGLMLEFSHKRHAEVKRFGRIPSRNVALGRASTPAELAHMACAASAPAAMWIATLEHPDGDGRRDQPLELVPLVQERVLDSLFHGFVVRADRCVEDAATLRSRYTGGVIGSHAADGAIIHVVSAVLSPCRAIDDDGEPAASRAGEKVLESLLARGESAAAILVWRHFGGTLLGSQRLGDVYKRVANEALVRWYSRQTLKALGKVAQLKQTMGGSLSPMEAAKCAIAFFSADAGAG